MADKEKKASIPQAPKAQESKKIPEHVEEVRKRFGKIGRPPKDVDERDVELLASCLVTKTVIARRLGISVDTLNRRFLEAYLRGLDTAKVEVHASQFVVGTVRENVRMLIHLGVNYLGQKTGYQPEKDGDEVDPDLYAGREDEDLSREELMAIAKLGVKKPKGKNDKGLDAGTGGEGDLTTGRSNRKPDRIH